LTGSAGLTEFSSASAARAVRIGIDVGGTFTDAVALEEGTGELLGQVKTPTTHTAPEGVALGIVQALQQLMQTVGIAPEQVRFIAHGTTQATNALLEGDVTSVGIVATGKGLEGARVRSETQVGSLELAPGKRLETFHTFVESEEFGPAVRLLRERGAGVIVAASAFSVDDPALEQKIVAAAGEEGLPATGTYEISSLYGLRVRTRTAVINASILPRMVETADMTERSVQQTGIPAPLMIMRCDGGVMTVGEVRRRPILTLLSGPAAGVAGALMYEKVSQGLFLEVGGTSVDISAVKDGRVMVEYAEVGGHKTYVRSLDVRTVGVAGGSLLRLERGRIVDVGPRSAHIAGLEYAVYADPSQIVSPILETFAPRPGDPADYLRIRCANGSLFALTTACAANLLGLVLPEHYAYGSAESARRAFAPLAAALGGTVEAAAQEALRVATAKAIPTIEALLQHYKLDKRSTTLIGGGGGAATLVPALGAALGMEWRLARNHQVISPIGVALALVRETVERTLPSPTQQDILRVRREAEEAALRSGAAEGTIEIHVEVDSVRNLVRATATGATELRARDNGAETRTEAELQHIAATAIGSATVTTVAQVGGWWIFEGVLTEKALFGLMRKERRLFRILDSEGVVRLAKEALTVQVSPVGQWRSALDQVLTSATTYGDAGAVLPDLTLLCGSRLIDLSGLQTRDQILTLATTELVGYSPDESLALLCQRRRA
jgi:N-methylhydantoinase A